MSIWWSPKLLRVSKHTGSPPEASHESLSVSEVDLPNSSFWSPLCPMHTFITDSIAIFLLLTYKSYEGTIHFLASSPSKEVGTHKTQNRCLLNKWKISEAAQYFGCNQPGSISSLLCWGCSLQVFFLFNPPPNIYISLMNIKSLVLDIDCWYNPAPLYFVIHVCIMSI